MTHSSDTVFALSSGRLPSGVAVLRISGPSALEAGRALAGTLPAPRMAKLCALRDPADGTLLDRALVLAFPAPQSSTGEDVIELHLHGGRAVVAAVLGALSRLAGLRPAEPGEFTRRAFMNGKMDLAEVEGLADLVAAESEAQRRQALALASGALSRRVAAWRADLIAALALIEAGLDFSDEGDVAGDLAAPAFARIAGLAQDMAQAVADGARGELVRDGLVIALAGPPNAGKSTLLNALAGREAAIVSEIAGTTRDLLEVHLELAGQAVTLVDMAGLRDTVDPIEKEGVRRARAKAEAADLVLWLSPEAAEPPEGLAGAMRVRTKADLGGATPQGWLALSVPTGEGLETLVEAIAARAEAIGGGEPALITRERQRRALENALDHLRHALDLGLGAPEEVLAEELRLAARALDHVVGRIDVEDVLDALFRTFCIGK